MTEIKRQDDDAWPRDHLPDWLDEMVRRLFLKLEKQLEAIETASEGGDEEKRERNARTMATLQRTLERLTKMEMARAEVRERCNADTEHAKAALERRMARLVAAGDAGAAAGKPER